MAFTDGAVDVTGSWYDYKGIDPADEDAAAAEQVQAEINDLTAFYRENPTSVIAKTRLQQLGAWPVEAAKEISIGGVSSGQFGERPVMGELTVGDATSTTHQGQPVEVVHSSML